MAERLPRLAALTLAMLSADDLEILRLLAAGTPPDLLGSEGIRRAARRALGLIETVEAVRRGNVPRAERSPGDTSGGENNPWGHIPGGSTSGGDDPLPEQVIRQLVVDLLIHSRAAIRRSGSRLERVDPGSVTFADDEQTGGAGRPGGRPISVGARDDIEDEADGTAEDDGGPGGRGVERGRETPGGTTGGASGRFRTSRATGERGGHRV